MDDLSSIGVLDMVLLIILFLLSAFFSSSETALLSVNRFKMEKLAKEGNKAAQLVLKLLDDPQKLITTILIGNNLVNIAAASISTAIAIKLFGDVGVGIATLVVTILTIIFGEVLPKNLALKYPEKLALLFTRFLLILEFLFYPFTYMLTKLISLLFPTDNENKLTEEELKIILEHSEKEGAIDKEEKELIENVLELDKTTVDEIMTPRTKIVAVEMNTPLKEVLNKMIESSYSKLPVYEENLDNIRGIVYLKDVLRNLNKNKQLKDIMRTPYFIPETKIVADLFKEMKEKKRKMAIVIDEYGGVAGLVTLEDILEYIVGQLDERSNEIRKIKDKVYIVDGNTKIIDLERAIDKEIDGDSNTVAGLIMHYLQKIPQQGDKIKIKDIVFEVLSVDNNKIKKVKVILP